MIKGGEGGDRVRSLSGVLSFFLVLFSFSSSRISTVFDDLTLCISWWFSCNHIFHPLHYLFFVKEGKGSLRYLAYSFQLSHILIFGTNMDNHSNQDELSKESVFILCRPFPDTASKYAKP